MALAARGRVQRGEKRQILAEKSFHLPPGHRVTFLSADRPLIFARDNADVVFCRDFLEQRVVVCRWPPWRPLHLVVEVHLPDLLLSLSLVFLLFSSSFAFSSPRDSPEEILAYFPFLFFPLVADSTERSNLSRWSRRGRGGPVILWLD